MAAGCQHAGDLGERAARIGQVFHHPRAGHQVEGFVRERQLIHWRGDAARVRRTMFVQRRQVKIGPDAQRHLSAQEFHDPAASAAHI